MDQKEPQIEVSLFPTTPAKPNLIKPVPICVPEEQNHLLARQHANEAVACSEFSAGAVPGTGIESENGKTCVQTASDNVSGWSKLGFSELLFLTEAGSGMLPDNNNGLENPFIPSLMSQFIGNVQGASYIACCSKETSQDTQLTPENAIRGESKQIASMQINGCCGEEENISAKKLDDNGTPPNKEPSEPVVEFAAVSTQLKENPNPDYGSSHDIDLSKTPQQKPRRRRKHQPKVIIEGKPKRTRKPATPKPVQAKETPTVKRKYVRRKGLNNTYTPPTEMMEELTKEIMLESAKTSCRRSLNFDIGPRDVSSTGRENATAHLDKETGIVEQKTNVGLARDLNTSMKKASNNSSQAPSTSPSKENPLAKRKYVRRKNLGETSAPTIEVIGELSKEMMTESSKTSCGRTLDIGIGARDESSSGIENATVGSSAGRENLNEHISMDNNSGKQVLDSYMSSPEDTQAPSTSPARRNPFVAKQEERATSKKKYVRRKVLSKSSTPTEMTADLIEPTIPKSTEIEQRRSLYFDAGARDESSTCRQNLNVHNIKESSVVAEAMHACLICDQSTSMKQTLYNFLSLPEDTQAPSTSSQSKSPGEKLDANSVENRNRRNNETIAQDGHQNSTKLLLKSVRQSNQNDPNISNSQISMIRLQMLGSKRKHSGTTRCADMSSMNEIGAYYNGFPSYQNMSRVRFPNLHKRRRSEKGKSSNASITSSVTTVKEAEPTFPQEVAQAHPYASSSSCRNFGFEYNAARVPTTSEATGSIIDDAQAFEEFELSLRRAQICDCESLTRIRNFETDPNYFAHQLCISDRQTFGDVERPQTSIDASVAEVSASLTKKKHNKNKSVVFSSSYSPINELQQCQNFALGNYHQSSGKSLDIVCEVRAIMQHVNALSEQLSQLNINKEARDLALIPYKKKKKKRSIVNGDGTIIPFQGSFGAIKKQLPRPKVDIDEETDRVRKLLMLDINSHGIDGTDENKAKWWEEERNVFRGRADSFIARMHLVQATKRSFPLKNQVDVSSYDSNSSNGPHATNPLIQAGAEKNSSSADGSVPGTTLAKPEEHPTAKRKHVRRKSLSKSNPPEAKAKENAIGKRKYVRRKRLNDFSTPPTHPIETEPAIPDSTKMAWRSSAGRENLNEHISKDSNDGLKSQFHGDLQVGAEKNSSSADGSVPGTTLANIASGNGKTCVQIASDNDSSWSNLENFYELLFRAGKIWANFSQILPDNNDELKSQFHDSLQDTTNIACCSKQTCQDILPTPDNAIRAESEQIASVRINIEEKHPRGEEEYVPDKMLDNIGTPQNIELCDPVVEFVAVSTPLKENHNPDNRSSHDIDLNKSPQQKLRRTQISASQKPAQSKETPCLDHDLNTSMKQATKNDMLISQDSPAPSTSCSRRNPL